MRRAFLPQFLITCLQTTHLLDFFASCSAIPQMTIYISDTTLLYHNLRAAQTVSVAHPSNKSNSGISNWATGVQVANANTTRLLTATVSSSSVTGFPVKSISSRTSNSESKPTYRYPIQPDGIELDDESDILATLVPDYMAQVSSEASSPKNVSSSHVLLLSSCFRNCTRYPSNVKLRMTRPILVHPLRLRRPARSRLRSQVELTSTIGSV